ncbi:2Fe-2S iron-sulfur cluster-binding protein [Pseudomonadota bacterium]
MGNIRNIRIVTGLVIYVYVTTHLLNLSLGLVSLEQMESWRPVIMAPWQSMVGVVLLYGSLLTHMCLGFEALYHRRTLRMSSFDTIQLVLALLLPPLVVIHVLGSRVVSTMVDFQPTYSWILMIYWKWTPVAGLRQVGVVLAAWIHGCMGLYYWMRLKSWWPRASLLLYPAAFIIPVLALLGFVEAGKEILILAKDPQWLASLRSSAASIDKETTAGLYQLEKVLLISYVVILSMVLSARWFRLLRIRAVESENSTKISYINGPTVTSIPGLSILEISRANALPHASVCGGRGRCATCRVRIKHGAEYLSPAQADELKLLEKVGAAVDVRLACQATVIAGSMTVHRLLPAPRESQVVNLLDYVSGEEQQVIVMSISCLGIAEILDNSGLPSPSVLDQYIGDCIDGIQAESGQLVSADASSVVASFHSETSLSNFAEAAYKIAGNAIESFNQIKKQLQQQVILDSTNVIRLDITLHVGRAILPKLEVLNVASKVVGEAIDELNRLREIKRTSSVLLSDDFATLLDLNTDGWKSIELSELSERFSTRKVYIKLEDLPVATPEESLEIAT